MSASQPSLGCFYKLAKYLQTIALEHKNKHGDPLFVFYFFYVLVVINNCAAKF